MSKFVLLFIVFLMLGCNPCREEIWNKSISPDGKWVAVTVMRDCGATTSEVVAINVHAVNEPELRQENNALVLKHGQTPGIYWRNNQTLVLDCRHCAANDIVSKVEAINSIKIEYDHPRVSQVP